MAPSTQTVSETNIVRGRIKMFNADRGFGFITGDDGVDYFFHAKNGRQLIKNGRALLEGTRESRVPQVGNRVFFQASPPREAGQRPQAEPWAFEQEEAPQPFVLEPIEKLIKRKAAGNIGCLMGLMNLWASEGEDETLLRVFAEFAPEGDKMWEDFQRRKKESGSAAYGWMDYALQFINQETIDKMTGPKSCQLQPLERLLVWRDATQDESINSPEAVFRLYYGDPSMLKKYRGTCKTCNVRSCPNYPK